MHRSIARSAASFAVVLVLFGCAGPERVYNVDPDTRLALAGFDPVSYRGPGAPRQGEARFQAEHAGAVYHFASAANRDRFRADPARYAPAYGGWCAWAMQDGERVEIDPRSYLIEGDRLLVFYDGAFGDTRAMWLDGDRDALRAAADRQWTGLLERSGPEGTGDGD